jgi:peptide subunit release factor 1 (eRF1)
MTIQYKYACSECSHEYIEQRAKTEPQYFTKCNVCGNADYELVNETVLADEVERAAGPETPTE